MKTGSRLALFALAIQFALSFGHFHFDPARASALIDVGLASVDGSASAEASRPDQHDTDHQSAAPCATCAVLTLTGNLLLSPPPVLLLPEAVELRYLATNTELVRHSSGRHPFQPRAPPAS